MQLDNFLADMLIVLGHGTGLNAGSAVPVNQHVAELRRRNLFGSVAGAFWKQEPQIKVVLAGTTAPRVFIAPLFISEGYFSSVVIPRELGFEYPERLQLVQNHTTLFYCRPVGSHQSMTKVVLSRAASVVAMFPFPRKPQPHQITLFIAGHGTGRNPESRKSVDRQVEIIRALHLYADVHAVFMEEEPRIGDCYGLSATKNVVVVPFFISDGLHTVEDIPVLLGEAPSLVKERVATGQPAWRNPTGIKGKLIWYATAVGTDPSMADVILERVRDAAGRGSPK